MGTQIFVTSLDCCSKTYHHFFFFKEDSQYLDYHWLLCLLTNWAAQIDGAGVYRITEERRAAFQLIKMSWKCLSLKWQWNVSSHNTCILILWKKCIQPYNCLVNGYSLFLLLSNEISLCAIPSVRSFQFVRWFQDKILAKTLAKQKQQQYAE